MITRRSTDTSWRDTSPAQEVARPIRPSDWLDYVEPATRSRWSV